jgi:L-ascorbate metabolism protein UlaG (beta-lactamase superfamily)
MGPSDAALACQLLGVSRAIPVHYAHNALVLGTQAGEEFRQAAAGLAPATTVDVLTPGQLIAL